MKLVLRFSESTVGYLGIFEGVSMSNLGVENRDTLHSLALVLTQNP